MKLTLKIQWLRLIETNNKLREGNELQHLFAIKLYMHNTKRQRYERTENMGFSSKNESARSSEKLTSARAISKIEAASA